jgi:NAD(P)H-hydrate epimerase
VRPFLGRLAKESHKGTQGRILVVGGASQYPGAPVLAACGALRAGGGLVTLAYPAAMAPLLGQAPNALIRRPLADGGAGHHTLAAGADYAALAASQDVLAIGPGLGRAPESLAVVQALLATDRPAVLDADGLGVFAVCPGALPRAATTVLTPHPGEMARLLAALGLSELAQGDRLVQASRVAARLQAYVVLKGAATVLAAPDGRLALNSSGSPALATGGSGDVLTGILAAFLAVAADPWAAVQAAVFLHGLAAERAPRGHRNLIADDLPQLLGEAMQEVSPFA